MPRLVAEMPISGVILPWPMGTQPTQHTTDIWRLGLPAQIFSARTAIKFQTTGLPAAGSDLAPTDYDFPMSCSSTECHTTKGSPAGHTTQAVNRHVARVSCQTCHIKTYGKNAGDSTATEATEYHRDWSLPHYNATTGLWHPTSYLQNNLVPVYKFWNKNSTNYLLYDVTYPNPVNREITPLQNRLGLSPTSRQQASSIPLSTRPLISQ